MTRTYPAKRARVATEVDAFCSSLFVGCDGTTWTLSVPAVCGVCGRLIGIGQRIVDGPEHARCADAGEALP